MSSTPQVVTELASIDHAEAMRLAESENERLLSQLSGLSADQWDRPTD